MIVASVVHPLPSFAKAFSDCLMFMFRLLLLRVITLQSKIFMSVLHTEQWINQWWKTRLTFYLIIGSIKGIDKEQRREREVCPNDFTILPLSKLFDRFCISFSFSRMVFRLHSTYHIVLIIVVRDEWEGTSYFGGIREEKRQAVYVDKQLWPVLPLSWERTKKKKISLRSKEKREAKTRLRPVSERKGKKSNEDIHQICYFLFGLFHSRI